MPTFEHVASGIPGLDALIDSIRMGDNVVWQLDDLDQYRRFARAFAGQALADGRRISYIRFAAHPPILEPAPGLAIRVLDPEAGFEAFTLRTHELISAGGRDAFYVFDSLSELQTAWASDLMMGCFFQVTCPYLFELNTVAYFGILRNRHSFDAVARVRDTTQVLLDVYGRGEDCYVQPLKVWNRSGPAMFAPHRLSGDGRRSLPLADAVQSARFRAILDDRGLAPLDASMDHWDRTFLAARRELEGGAARPETARRLAGLLMGRDPRILELAREHFSLVDLLRVKERMIGSGAVGGKSAGMLLARKVVERRLPELRHRLEPHDSFFVGTDVFYAFLVENGWWRLRLEQRTPAGFFRAAEELGRRMASGRFPAGVRDQFRRMLEYFGPSPIIVRSSSLLEDGFGNAFAGKYESVFLANAGPPEDRLAALEAAVKRVYASSMDASALSYRRRRRLDELDEQMALLVQRVSGSDWGGMFMPTAAGVAHSRNAYVWNERIDPGAGMVRLVAGLGTRAVDRVDADYPRVAALNVPRLLPVSGDEERARFSQHQVDVLDLGANRPATVGLEEARARWPKWLAELLCEHDRAAEAGLAETGASREVYYCNCEKLLASPDFVGDLRLLLAAVAEAYEYPVDMEFAANFAEGGDYVINLLQCRPLQIRGRGAAVAIPNVPAGRVYFDLAGCNMGGGVDWRLDHVILVDEDRYARLDRAGKYETARTIGRINRILDGLKSRRMLVGPGRWGTRSPDLGVPVSFAEIAGVHALCEVPFAGGSARPELSYGSHFFQDLMETGIFYAAILPERPGCRYRPELLAGQADIAARLLEMHAAEAARSPVLVYDVRRLGLWLKSDVISGRTLCAALGEEGAGEF